MARHTRVDRLCLDQLVDPKIDRWEKRIGVRQVARNPNEIQIDSATLGMCNGLLVNHLAPDNKNGFNVGVQHVDSLVETARKTHLIV